MTRAWTLTLSLLLVPAGLLSQAPVAIQMASSAPAGSVWDRNLQQMGAEWRKVSADAVRLTVFPGGQLGDENKVVALLRAGRPDAAALTSIGLSRIDPAYNVFSVPFFFNSYDELHAVLDRMAPTLDARLQKAGFVRLAWGNGGWVRVFSRTPVATLDDLKKVKLFTSVGEDTMLQWYKNNGFNAVALAMTDILTGLSNGQIDAVPTTPTAALSFQWYSRTPHMLDLGFAPLVGAIVVSNKSWGRVPPPTQAALLKSAREMEARLAKLVPTQDAESIEEMKKRKLMVHRPAGAGWDVVAQSLTQSLRGSMVPVEIYDLAVKERDAYRATRKQ
jgi:TRAP-type C4-dicarboxylate transport system substrate-binding protein